MEVTVVRARKGAGETIADLIELAVGRLLNAWIVMLLLGAAHHEIDERIPPLGYWHSLLVVYLIACLLGNDSHVLWTKRSRS